MAKQSDKLGFYTDEFRDVLNVYVNHIIYSCSIIGRILPGDRAGVCLGLFNFREPEKVQVRGPEVQLDKKCFVIFIRGTKRVTERPAGPTRLCGVPKGSYLDPRGWSLLLSPFLSLSLAPLVLLTPVITRRHTRTLYRPSFSSGLPSFFTLFLYVLHCCLNGARFVHPRKGRSYIHGDEDLSHQIPSPSGIYLPIHSFSFKAFQHQIISRH